MKNNKFIIIIIFIVFNIEVLVICLDTNIGHLTRIKRSSHSVDCNKIIDAAIQWKHDEHILLFNDSYFWKYSTKNGKFVNKSLIKDAWIQVHIPLDAGITLEIDKTYYNILMKVN